MATSPGHAQDSDLVILRSGNPVVGEVKSMRRGSLQFDTPEMDVVSIDWNDIAILISPNFFEVTLVSGQQLFGGLGSADTAMLVIVGVSRSDTVPFRDVASIAEIERGFWGRTNGFIDLGSNLARANSLASILVSGRFNYRGTRWGFDVTGESYWQKQTSVSSAGDTTTQRTSRNSAALTVNRYLGGRWGISWSVQTEQNEELDLDLRMLGTLRGDLQIMRTQELEFYVGAGGTINRERFVGTEGTTSGEILVVTGFDAFDVGDLDIYAELTNYASAADGGRFRLNFDGRIAWEIFNDFTIGINITERLDTRPPSATAEKRDFQYSLTIGWSWS
ncbi:MAG: DUF481 domain-containing protein [Gemmatimonadetes bacterium]|nr:DUF481 domain-containing protein [Gemmatimonadota bacterium]